jgi:probable F420-dependent oxidoreductase
VNGSGGEVRKGSNVVKVGVNLINYGQGATPESLARWGQLVEALGYHFLMASDHVATTPDVQAEYPAPFYDPFVTLAWLAGSTREIELGTTVTVLPYRHPLQVASMAQTIGRLSGGRFILGVGVGWARQEFAALGVPFEKRGAMTDDYVAAIRALWAGDVASYEGRFVAFEDVRTVPDSASSPPIWVGGASEAGLRRAVRYGDGWHPNNVRLDWLREEGLPRLKEIAREESKPVPSLCPRIRLRLTGSPLDDERRLPGEGTLNQIRADFEALQALGAEYVLLDTYYGDPEATRHHERTWHMLATLTESVLDLHERRLR